MSVHRLHKKNKKKTRKIPKNQNTIRKNTQKGKHELDVFVDEKKNHDVTVDKKKKKNQNKENGIRVSCGMLWVTTE